MVRVSFIPALNFHGNSPLFQCRKHLYLTFFQTWTFKNWAHCTSFITLQPYQTIFFGYFRTDSSLIRSTCMRTPALLISHVDRGGPCIAEVTTCHNHFWPAGPLMVQVCAVESLDKGSYRHTHVDCTFLPLGLEAQPILRFKWAVCVKRCQEVHRGR